MLNAIIFIIGLCVLIGPHVDYVVKKYEAEKKAHEFGDPSLAKVSSAGKVGGTIFGLLLIIFALSFVIIPTGNTGVKITLGQVDKKTYQNGFNWKIPLIQSVEKVNNKQQDLPFNEMTVVSETLERNTVTYSGITVTYSINPEYSAWIYANVSDYTNNLVSQSLVSSAIKSTSKTLDPVDATNRAILEPTAKEYVQASLDEKYGADVVLINKVVIEQAEFDKEYDDRIAQKQQAQIEYETQQINNKKALELAENEAAIKIKQAQAEADAKKIAAEAEAEANKKISDSLDAKVLAQKYYDAWNGVLPQTVAGDNTSIMLQVPNTNNIPASNKSSTTTEAPAETEKTE